MAIAFPNPSRTYDATRRAVRFWGYDQSMEISFFVTEAALKALPAGPRAAVCHEDLLAAFDAHRARIHSAAEKVLRHGGRKGSYEVDANDL
jgi:hypothetical protein